MKRTILLLTGLATAGSLAVYCVTRCAKKDVPTGAEMATVAPGNPVETPPITSAGTTANRAAHSESRPQTGDSNQATAAAAAPSSVEAIAFVSAIDTLVSPHATYAEKRAALKQLQDSGRLADAAVELEKRMAGDPGNALYPTALGQTYLRMCATTTDVRSQAIWAMTADTDFENAVNLDPSDWDARFTRALAMSYWPANLNKGDEVIQQFNMLISQQEQETPQPQFAQTYELLGKQYQKAGQTGAAQQVWQRGAALYPGDSSLQSVLAASSADSQ